MTLKTKYFRTAHGAFAYLEKLALDESHTFYFRGHGDASWDLGTTYSRHSSTPITPATNNLDEITRHFIGALKTTGKKLPFDSTDARSKLEYARHYGLPSPLLDWSFSPYTAMFFAFNGRRSASSKRSVIYALNVEGLADLFARRVTMLPSGSPGPEYAARYLEFTEPLDFSHGYPGGILRFMKTPSSWNTRMVRQMGGFLYDTLDYRAIGFGGLEDFIQKSKETPGPSSIPTLYKVYVPRRVGADIFKHLDLAGFTGTRLLDDYEGAVADVANAYN